MTPASASALTSDAILERLESLLPGKTRPGPEHAGQRFAVVERADLIETLTCLKEHAELAFDVLADVTAVDHLFLEVPEIPERFAVVYQLSSSTRSHRFRLKTPVPEDDLIVPSACALWPAALWGERETHDMFGIAFEGNPDLRRLLMPSNYDGFPLQKDYPLRGRGERDSFPRIRRVPDDEASGTEDDSTGGASGSEG